MKGITAEEKEFGWKMVQDMLPIGRRIHRANVEKKCQNKLNEQQYCVEMPDLTHKLLKCPAIKNKALKVKIVLEKYLGEEIADKKIITLSFKNRNANKNQIAVWFAIRALYRIYHAGDNSKNCVLDSSIKEIDWNLSLNRKIGSAGEMMNFRSILYKTRDRR